MVIHRTRDGTAASPQVLCMGLGTKNSCIDCTTLCARGAIRGLAKAARHALDVLKDSTDPRVGGARFLLSMALDRADAVDRSIGELGR